MLIRNHYFRPDALPTNIVKCFSFLESKFDTNNYRAILHRNLNAHYFNWELAALAYIIIITDLNEVECTPPHVLWVLPDHCSAHNNNLLHLIFTNFDISGVTLADMGMVIADVRYRQLLLY